MAPEASSLANDTHSAMVREISELSVSRPRRPSFPIALILAVGLAAPLAACGRKGALDPPPGGYVLDRSTTRTPVSGLGAPPPSDATPPGAANENRTVVSPGPHKRLPLDWLLD